MSSSTWRRDWVSEKCQIALRLSKGESGGGYPEAAILICAVLSALSAELWSGIRIDRVRFIEMLVRCGAHAAESSIVSVPLLVQHLAGTSRGSEAKALEQSFAIPAKSHTITGRDVDRSEADVLAVCPNLGLKEVRTFSYAAVLYGEIRSSYAHEYRPGDLADSWPMTSSLDESVSYINRIEISGPRRLIHFHIEWLAEIAIEIASQMDGMATVQRPRPAAWWAEEG